jgi:PPM family protein phosphatase
MRVEFRGLTDVGRVRKNNEDAFLIDEGMMLGVVCDGMGGHSSGEVASAMAVDTLSVLLKLGQERWLSRALPGRPGLPATAANLVAATRMANQRIYINSAAHAAQRGMGTTMAAIAFSRDGSVSVANVGDSRVYRLRGGELHQLTRDHTYLAELLEDKELSAEEAKTFKQKSSLSRALGTSATVAVDVRVDTVKDGDVYLVCSDGLHGALDDDTLVAILQANRRDMTMAAHMLVDEANRCGGPDNVTVVVALVDDAPSGSTALEKVEFADDPADLARRERALRHVFDIPADKGSFGTVLVVAIASVLVIAALVAALMLSRKRQGGRTVPKAGYLTITINPSSISDITTVLLNGRRLDRLVGVMMSFDSLPDTLIVSAPNYISETLLVVPDADTTKRNVTLTPDTRVGLRLDNKVKYDTVVLWVVSEEGFNLSETLATSGLVSNDLIEFPLRGPGIYTFRVLAGGKDVVPLVRKMVGHLQMISIVPDNPEVSGRVLDRH